MQQLPLLLLLLLRFLLLLLLFMQHAIYCSLCGSYFKLPPSHSCPNCHILTYTYKQTTPCNIIHCVIKPRVKTAKDNKDNIFKSSRLTQTQQSLSNQLPAARTCPTGCHRGEVCIESCQQFHLIRKESHIVYCL